MKNGVTAVMTFDGIGIFQLKDLPTNKNVVRLTKWLPATEVELRYITKEYRRIIEDPLRFGIIIYHIGNVALYVNDITYGAFDRMSEDEE